ncbi:MAG: alkaline phosphatase family protein [Carbonactinosporaceae bacterium]
MPVPRYGAAALSDLLPSVLAALGVPGEPNTLGLAPAPRACVLLVDGLGLELLRAHPAAAPYLTRYLTGLPGSGETRVLTAGFPATTATSLGSVGTGLPPGGHGLVGYLVAVPRAGRLMNSLRWDPEVDPELWQPQATVFERAAAAGVAVSQVAPGAFQRSGLTRAALRGTRYVAAESGGERVATAAGMLSASERALVYVYVGDLDATGHRNGCGSDAWRAQLGQLDLMVAQLAERLPAGAVLYVTADHGMVDVAPERRVDFDREPRLSEGVLLLGGEARARHVYTRPGAADDVLAAWRERLGDRMWVVSRDEAVAGGWFGPAVTDWVLPRIGDVLAAAYDDVAVVTPADEPLESALIGHHGSMTPAEQCVPLLEIRG